MDETKDDLFATPTNKEVKESFHNFLDTILEHCYVGESTGMWRCKKCSGLVSVDWFEKELECLRCDI